MATTLCMTQVATAQSAPGHEVPDIMHLREHDLDPCPIVKNTTKVTRVNKIRSEIDHYRNVQVFSNFQLVRTQIRSSNFQEYVSSCTMLRAEIHGKAMRASAFNLHPSTAPDLEL